MERWKLHWTVGQYQAGQKNRVVVINRAMLYNGLEEIVHLEVDTQTNLHNAGPGFRDETAGSTASKS